MKKRNPSNFLARECIATALIQLASQKPFSAITVSELTQRAGVSRMTQEGPDMQPLFRYLPAMCR